MVQMLTELEYHGYSPRLQELTLSLERALGAGLQTWKGITFRDVNGGNEQTEKPKPRDIFNRGLQIPLGHLRPLHQKHSFGQNLARS